MQRNLVMTSLLLFPRYRGCVIQFNVSSRPGVTHIARIGMLPSVRFTLLTLFLQMTFFQHMLTGISRGLFLRS